VRPRLYRALGYQDMSLRAPRTQILMNVPSLRPGFVVVRLGAAEGARLSAAAYAEVDMAPDAAEFGAVLGHALSEGTFLAVRREGVDPALFGGSAALAKLLEGGELSDQESAEAGRALTEAILDGDLESWGGVSLWNGSDVTNWNVMRVIFKKETWLSLPFRLALGGCALGLLGLWGWRLGAQLSEAVAPPTEGAGWPWGVGGTALHALEWLSFGAVAYGCHKAAELVRFIVSRDSLRLRARAHAPMRSGEAGLECLRAAAAASMAHARRNGFGMCASTALPSILRLLLPHLRRVELRVGCRQGF